MNTLGDPFFAPGSPVYGQAFQQPVSPASGAVQLGVAGLLGYGTYKLWPKHKVWGVLLGLMALGWAGSAARSFSS